MPEKQLYFIHKSCLYRKWLCKWHCHHLGCPMLKACRSHLKNHGYSNSELKKLSPECWRNWCSWIQGLKMEERYSKFPNKAKRYCSEGNSFQVTVLTVEYWNWLHNILKHSSLLRSLQQQSLTTLCSGTGSIEVFGAAEIFHNWITGENWKNLQEVIFVQTSKVKKKKTLWLPATSRKYCSNLLSGNLHFCLLRQ